jgi:hypothetical protein
MAAEAAAAGPVLPIRQYAEDIRRAVAANSVVVVIGETGSGKTTQLSQVRGGRRPSAISPAPRAGRTGRARCRPPRAPRRAPRAPRRAPRSPAHPLPPRSCWRLALPSVASSGSRSRGAWCVGRGCRPRAPGAGAVSSRGGGAAAAVAAAPARRRRSALWGKLTCAPRRPPLCRRPSPSRAAWPRSAAAPWAARSATRCALRTAAPPPHASSTSQAGWGWGWVWG